MPVTNSELQQLFLEAEFLLDRYRWKANSLVQQTGGKYEGGEAIQFLVADYEEHKAKFWAFQDKLALDSQLGTRHD